MKYRLYYSSGDYENRRENWEDFNSVEEALDYISSRCYFYKEGFQTGIPYMHRNDFFPGYISQIEEKDLFFEDGEEITAAMNKNKNAIQADIDNRIKVLTELKIKKEMAELERLKGIYENT